MLGRGGLTVENISAASSMSLEIVPVPPHFCGRLPDRQEAGIFDV
jgi:hypothetical protein